MLEKAGAEYNAEILNPIEHASQYETVSKKALNLGIYSTDLSYASIYEQSAEIMVFSACSKKLSDALGVTEAFTERTIERIESNLADKDSILDIVTETYYITDTHLKTSQRASLSALILAGAWMEGLHIACHVASTQPENELIRLRLMEQKFALNNLLILTRQYADDPKMQPVLQDLEAVHSLFAEVNEVVNTEPSVQTHNDTQSSTINTGRELVAEAATIEQIRERVSAIRAGYIQP